MSPKYIFGLLLFVLAIVCGQEVPTIWADSLSRTSVTPVLNTEITRDQNLIYCATFQLAWNELRDSVTAHQTEDPAIIRELDKKTFTKDYLSEDCYVAMVGRYVNIVEKINELLTRKFGNEAWLLTKERVLENLFSDSVLMAYAFLYKNLVFKEMFENLEEPIKFMTYGDTVDVDGFGVKEYKPQASKHKALGKQAIIYHYTYNYETRSREFIIGLLPESTNDEIIIAQIAPRNTLMETYAAVKEIIAKSKPDTLRKFETLQVPKLDFDIEHTFPEVERYLSSLVWGPAKAYQRIKFRLNEKGAILKSEAIIIAYEEIEVIEPRYLVVSEPFLIYLKQKDSPYPYLAMWVGNEELLLKTE